LSGTWKWMSAPASNAGDTYNVAGLIVRVS
jgi:hypothetical protein